MTLKPKKSVVTGALVGISIAILTIIFARLNDRWDNEALRTVINFLASIPILIFWLKLNMSDIAFNILFFCYWVLLGGIAGWILSGKKALYKIALVILIICLAVSHRMIQVKMESELRAALEGLGKLFTGEAYIEGNK